MGTNPGYPHSMKWIVSILVILSMGCTQPHAKPEKPSGPAPRIKTKKKTMVCKVSMKKQVVAIIDTGFTPQSAGQEKVLCKFGHKDFSVDQKYYEDLGTTDPVPKDLHGHGTNIAGVIAKYAKDNDFCIVVLKYYNSKGPDVDNLTNTVRAIDHARQIKADIINYSGGGIATAQIEIDAVKKYLDQGGQFVAAAGNESADLGVSPYYPAMDDDRVIVVGNGKSNTDRAPTSNFGSRVNRWEDGKQTGFNLYLEGTSQAAAVATGKIISEKKCEKPVDSASK